MTQVALPKVTSLDAATIRDRLSKMTSQTLPQNSRFRFNKDDVWRDGNGNPSPLPASHPASGQTPPATTTPPPGPQLPHPGYCIWEWQNVAQDSNPPMMAWREVATGKHCIPGKACRTPIGSGLMAEGTQVVTDCH